MGSQSFVNKQNKKIRQGQYQIQSKKGKYLNQSVMLTSGCSDENTFLVCKHESSGYYLKTKTQEKQELWLGPKYFSKNKDKNWENAGNIMWHFFEVKTQQYLITSQEIKGILFFSHYQALTYDQRSNQVIFKKIDTSNNFKNQIWQIYKINQSKQQTIHDTNKNAARKHLINKLSKDLQNQLKSKSKKQKHEQLHKCSNFLEGDSKEKDEWNKQSQTIVIQVDP